MPSGATPENPWWTAVLLKHTLADGTCHYDWMVLIPGSDPPRLASFRVGERIDTGRVASFRAERIGDHRGAYLEHEGEVSGGRGTVSRVARGRLRIERDEGGKFEAAGELGRAAGTFSGRRAEGEAWEFRFVPLASRGSGE